MTVATIAGTIGVLKIGVAKIGMIGMATETMIGPATEITTGVTTMEGATAKTAQDLKMALAAMAKTDRICAMVNSVLRSQKEEIAEVPVEAPEAAEDPEAVEEDPEAAEEDPEEAAEEAS